MGDSKSPRVIKRYANRKLYDMSESCYITHDEIAALVRDGEEIRIIDNRTKEDLTSATLTQILFDKERKTKKSLPLSTLRNLFQQSGDFIQERITQPLTNLRDEAEKNVRKVFRPRSDEDLAAAPEPILDEDPAKPRPSDAIREWMQGTQQAFETLQRNVEERWGSVVTSVGQFDVNHGRIVELEKRIAAIEARLAALEDKAGA